MILRVLLGSATALLLAGAAAAQDDDGLELRGTLDLDAFQVDEAAGDRQGDAIGKLRLRWRTVLDDGTEIGFRAEARAATRDFFRYPMIDAPLAVDRLFVSAEAGWGRVELGLRDGIAAQFQLLPPGFARSLRVDGGQTLPLEDATGGPLTPGRLILRTTPNATDRAAKAIYMTPRLFGAQAGVSYTPDRGAILEDEFSLRPGDADRQRNVWEFGLNYDSTFDSLRIRAALVYLTAEVETPADVTVTGASPWVSDDLEEYGASLSAQLSLGEGETLRAGIAYRATNAQGGFADANPIVRDDGSDARIWSIGATYETGPWTVGAGYVSGRTDVAVSGLLAPVFGRQEGDAFEIGGAYALNDAVDVALGYQKFSFDAAAALLPAAPARGAPATLDADAVFTEISVDF